jgi:hypothetical protein
MVPAGIAEGIAIAWDGRDPHVIAGCGGYEGPGTAADAAETGGRVASSAR